MVYQLIWLQSLQKFYLFCIKIDFFLFLLLNEKQKITDNVLILLHELRIGGLLGSQLLLHLFKDVSSP